jgi:hypothetical protein
MRAWTVAGDTLSPTVADMNEQADESKDTPTCGLGRSLGACALRSAGCEQLFDVLKFLYPPSDVLAELKRRNDLTPSGRAWLRRLATIENGGRG